MTEAYSNMSHYYEQEQQALKKANEQQAKKQKTYDTVQSPIHYTMGVTIEPIDYIIDHQLDFLEGNVIKYVSRWTLKNGIEDLKKARFYLDKLIEREENAQKELEKFNSFTDVTISKSTKFSTSNSS